MEPAEVEEASEAEAPATKTAITQPAPPAPTEEDELEAQITAALADGEGLSLDTDRVDQDFELCFGEGDLELDEEELGGDVSFEDQEAWMEELEAELQGTDLN